MRLTDLKLGETAMITTILNLCENDPLAHRLKNLGFVPGETVKLLAQASIWRDPILVSIGFTRFALRRSEAMRVAISPL